MGDTQGRVPEITKEGKGRNPVLAFFIRMAREKPLGTICGFTVLLFFFTGIFAEFVAPYGFNQQFRQNPIDPPSLQFWLGTDNLGRDLLTRMIYGARISMTVGVVASSISLVVSCIVGMPSGYLGGRFDLVVQRFADAWTVFPDLVLIIAMVTLIGPGLWKLVFLLGINQGIQGARSVRGAVIGIRENVYVEAAEAIGAPTWRILMRHILPNVMAPLIILLTTRMPGMILSEAGLSFLGLGIPPPTPSWGGMLSGAGLGYMYLAPWMAIWPGLALSIVVYCMNMFGDALRDLLDPRLKGGLGRFGRIAKKVGVLAKK